MIQIPLTNLFNFEVPFSVGYDKDGRVSIESLFKCHQGFTPISRQQAHSRHHLRPDSNWPNCATFLVWGIALILARSSWSQSWLLLFQTTLDAATLIKPHFFSSMQVGQLIAMIWASIMAFGEEEEISKKKSQFLVTTSHLVAALTANGHFSNPSRIYSNSKTWIVLKWKIAELFMSE